MKKFRNLNNRELNNQIITRRSNMKKVLAAVVASGLAFAVVAGAVVWTDSGNSGEAFAAETIQAYIGTSPDLPVVGERVEIIQEYVGTSPDLPVAGEKVEIIREYVGTSPDLPEMDAKVADIARPMASTARNAVDWNNGLYAGELTKVEPNIISEQTARDLVDFNNGFYAGEMLESEGKVIDTAELNESGFTRLSIVGNAFNDTSPDLPEMDAKIAIRAYIGTSPDLPELGGERAKVEIRGGSFAGTSPDLPEIDGKVALRAYVDTSPDLPEAGEIKNIDGGEYRMVGSSFANTSPDLP